LQPLAAKIKGGDIDPAEIIIGTALSIPEISQTVSANPPGGAGSFISLVKEGVKIETGVKRAAQAFLDLVSESDFS
jgi:hypothetical protein